MEYELNKRIAALPADKIKMLVQKVAKKGNPLSFGQIKHQLRDGRPFPMSYPQERLWFLSQLAPYSIAYHNPLAARVISSFSFDLNILERSLNEIVRRHEILRTTFDFIGGQFCQVIASELQIKISYQDLRGIQHSLREAEAIKIACLENQQPFNLNQGLLLRFKVLHLEDTEYIHLSLASIILY